MQAKQKRTLVPTVVINIYEVVGLVNGTLLPANEVSFVSSWMVLFSELCHCCHDPRLAYW